MSSVKFLCSSLCCSVHYPLSTVFLYHFPLFFSGFFPEFGSPDVFVQVRVVHKTRRVHGLQGEAEQQPALHDGGRRQDNPQPDGVHDARLAVQPRHITEGQQNRVGIPKVGNNALSRSQKYKFLDFFFLETITTLAFTYVGTPRGYRDRPRSGRRLRPCSNRT